MLIFVCLGSLVIILLLISFIKENVFRKNLPPGPYRFPLVGSLIQINKINSTAPYLAFDEMKKEYGDILALQLGSLFAVVLGSYDVMQEYLTKAEWSGRMFNEWIAERSFHKELGIIFAKQPGPWQEVRRFTIRALKDYGFGKKNTMESIIHSELTDIMDNLKTDITATNGIHSFQSYFTTSVLNVLCSMLVGKRYEYTDQKLLQLVRIFRTLAESGNFGNNFLLAYPNLKDYFPDWTGMTMQRKSYVDVHDFMREIIQERRKIGIYKTNPENVIDEFLRQIDINSGELNTVYTDEQLNAVMFDLYLAGSETSSHTLSWAILLMILHPQVQKKVQDEIDTVIPRGSLPKQEHESKLHYVRATIMEVHRVGTVLPLIPLRETLQDTICNKYFIPKGTLVIPNMYSVFHDKEHWKDPDVFRPDRFIDEEGKFQPDDWMKPFGFGRRICLGENLASMSLFYYFTSIMQQFTLSQVPGEPAPTLEPIIGFTNGPHPFKALVEVRF